MWPREIRAPILVAGSSGSPTVHCANSAATASRTRSLTERWTISREPALQFSPMFQKIAIATLAATFSKSVTSGNTTCGLLPPSSRRTRLRFVSADQVQEVAPDLGRAGEGDGIDVRVAPHGLADARARAR